LKCRGREKKKKYGLGGKIENTSGAGQITFQLMTKKTKPSRCRVEIGAAVTSEATRSKG